MSVWEVSKGCQRRRSYSSGGSSSLGPSSLTVVWVLGTKPQHFWWSFLPNYWSLFVIVFLRTANKKCCQSCLPTSKKCCQSCLPTSKNVVNPACLPPKNVVNPACLPPKMSASLPAYLQKCRQACLPTSKNVGKPACLPPRKPRSFSFFPLPEPRENDKLYLFSRKKGKLAVFLEAGRQACRHFWRQAGRLADIFGGRQAGLPTFLEVGRQHCRHFWR